MFKPYLLSGLTILLAIGFAWLMVFYPLVLIIGIAFAMMFVGLARAYGA